MLSVCMSRAIKMASLDLLVFMFVSKDGDYTHGPSLSLTGMWAEIRDQASRLILQHLMSQY